MMDEGGSSSRQAILHIFLPNTPRTSRTFPIKGREKWRKSELNCSIEARNNISGTLIFNVSSPARAPPPRCPLSSSSSPLCVVVLVAFVFSFLAVYLPPNHDSMKLLPIFCCRLEKFALYYVSVRAFFLSVECFFHCKNIFPLPPPRAFGCPWADG